MASTHDTISPPTDQPRHKITSATIYPRDGRIFHYDTARDVTWSVDGELAVLDEHDHVIAIWAKGTWEHVEVTR